MVSLRLLIAGCFSLVACTAAESSKQPIEPEPMESKYPPATDAGTVTADAPQQAVDAFSGDAAPLDAAQADAAQADAGQSDAAKIEAGALDAQPVDAPSDATPSEFFEVTIGGVQRMKTKVRSTLYNAGVYCPAYTHVTSEDTKLTLSIKKATTTGTFDCTVNAFDAPMHSANQGTHGSCQAVVTSYGPEGSFIIGTLSGTIRKGSDLSLLPFTGSFSATRGKSSKCADPAPPP